MLEESSVLLLLASRVYHLHFQGDQQSWQYKTLLKAIKIHSFRKKTNKQKNYHVYDQQGIFFPPVVWGREESHPH